ncbi:hypothetical protein J4468_03240 [Candidatus Woesearchaeota archaeon]|nr:hypothetical protein [Candidatus Woesearchaeota archaeon]
MNFSKVSSRVFAVSILLVFVMFLTVATEADPVMTFLAFLPSFINISTAILILDREIEEDFFVWTVPVITALFFLIIYDIHIFPAIDNLDISFLALLNIIISYVLIFIIYMGNVIRKPVIKKQMTKEDITKAIRSLEGDCKGINFAIGRVYTRKNGGTKLGRQELIIEKMLYNALSDALVQGDKVKILDMVNKLHTKLKRLELRERDIFGKSDLQNIKRDPEGNDKIIDVLIMNDSDPVHDYYTGAMQTCEEIIENINKI